MGGKKAGYNTNRTEFLSDSSGLEGDIEYRRNGGCFVTTKRAIFFFIIAVITSVAVAALMYFYGPDRSTTKNTTESSDIEQLLTDSLNKIDDEDFRLPTNLRPLHYRIRIHPYLNEPDENKEFTFSGRVTILFQCIKKTNQIILNSENLHIFNDDVIVTRSTTLKTSSQVIEKSKAVHHNPSIFKRDTKDQGSQIANTNDLDTHDDFVPTVSGIPASTVPVSISLSSSVPSTSPSDPPNHAKMDDATTGSEQSETTTVNPKSSSSIPSFFYQLEKATKIDIESQEEINKTSRYVIHLHSSLQTGLNYTVDVLFSGNITNNLLGLYKTSYSAGEGNKRWLLTTHFQPIFARRVFPCFDEPSYKATFELSIARHKNMTVLSNTALKETEPLNNKPDWVWDHFEKTPLMSTYLIAFTICDFEHLKPSSSTAGGPEFKVWASSSLIANAKYASEIGPKIIAFLENYFGVKYPLSKLDLIAVPELPQTAMENWGLISFRDTALLVDTTSDSWEVKMHVFNVIARKLTQQWFGNLVTMEWWSELWLTEGFATYMEDIIENAIDPALEDLDIFSLRITQTILESDKLKSVRSLHVDIKDPAQIEQLFDDVATNKGSCLIRMLNYTLTEPVFKSGIQNYFRKWMYKSSNQDHLWAALTQAAKNTTTLPSDLSIKDLMDSWINREGYPVVSVVRNYSNGGALIKQDRFIHGNASRLNLWYIPVTYTKEDDNGSVATLWLKKEPSIMIPNFSKPDNHTWVMFNIEEAGFYRVNYDVTNWLLLKDQLMDNSDRIMPSNRGQLLNDAFELANAGVLDYKIAFELTKYLGPNERKYVPWYSLFNSLQSLQDTIQSTQYNGEYQKYIINMIRPVYDELGTNEKENESENNRLLRNFILKIVCGLNYDPCLKWADEKYQEWMASTDPDKNNPIPFDFREVVQCSAIKMGGQKEWEFLWQRTRNPSILPVDLKSAYLSLGCSREPWIINSYLERSLNGSIPLQNIPYVWKSIGHPVGLNVGFTLLRSHWDRIYNQNKHIFSNLNCIFEDFLSKLSTNIDLQDLSSFYISNKDNLRPVSSLILHVVDRIKSRIYWSKSHMETVATWLIQNNTP